MVAAHDEAVAASVMDLGNGCYSAHFTVRRAGAWTLRPRVSFSQQSLGPLRCASCWIDCIRGWMVHGKKKKIECFHPLAWHSFTGLLPTPCQQQPSDFGTYYKVGAKDSPGTWRHAAQLRQ